MGFSGCYMFCCALLCVHSSFAIILMGKRASCFALFVFLVSRDCCMTLSQGAIGLSAVCDCGIFWSYSITIFHKFVQIAFHTRELIHQYCTNFCKGVNEKYVTPFTTL